MRSTRRSSGVLIALGAALSGLFVAGQLGPGLGDARATGTPRAAGAVTGQAAATEQGAVSAQAPLTAQGEVSAQAPAGLDAAHAACFGAASMDPKRVEACTGMVWPRFWPALDEFTSQLPPFYNDRCRTWVDETAVKPCVIGDHDATVRVLLIGDSHAVHWASALSSLALKRHWKVTVLWKAACPFTGAAAYRSTAKANPTCEAWNANVQRWLAARRPFMLAFTSNTHHLFLDSAGRQSDAITIRGFRRAWAPLTSRGTKVVALVDNPAMTADVIRCVMKDVTYRGKCATAPSVALADEDFFVRAAGPDERAYAVDLRPMMCKTRACQAVMGGVIAYRDASSHLTQTFARTLAPYLEARLPLR